jgi:serine/threonine-protein kinase
MANGGAQGEGKDPMPSDDKGKSEERTLSHETWAALLETLAAQGMEVDESSAETIATLRQGDAEDPRLSTLSDLPPLPLSRSGDAASPEGDLIVGDDIGKGGMGVVHAARQKSLDREVAIKRLRDQDADVLQVGALLREARVMGRLEHPNIVPVHALGTGWGSPIVVMKKVEGRPWTESLKEGPTDLVHHLGILIKVCNALEFAHDQDIIHRDIKPDNVMLGAYGEVYLVDWGLALVQGQGGVDGIEGTPVYMAPEMARGNAADIDARTDVFLLGATLHELLTGKPRHLGDSLRQVLQNALSSLPMEYADELAPELGTICNRACAHDPEKRFESVAAFREAIEEYLERRDALALTRAAMKRLSSLQGSIDDEAHDTEIQTLFNETRLALENVLFARPDLEEAQQGLRRGLTLMARYELRRGKLEVAEHLIEKMSNPPRDLLDAARDAKARKEADRELLERMTREEDSGIGLRQRRRLAISMISLLVLVLGGLYWVNPTTKPTASPLGLFMVGLGVWGVVIALVVIWRKSLFSNAYNRRWTRALIGMVGAFVLHRGVEVVMDTPVIRVAQMDLVVMGGALIAAAGLSPWLFLVGGMSFAMAVVAVLQPDLTRLFVNLVVLSAPIMLWWLWGERRAMEMRRLQKDDA